MSYVRPAVSPDPRNEQSLLLMLKNRIANGPATLSLDDLALAEGISKKQISSLFRKLMGISVTQFMLDERMRRAQRLVLHTSQDIGVMAHTMGYSSTANFSNAFRDYVGMSPSDFREHAPLDAVTSLQGAMHWDSSEY